MEFAIQAALRETALRKATQVKCDSHKDAPVPVSSRFPDWRNSYERFAVTPYGFRETVFNQLALSNVVA